MHTADIFFKLHAPVHDHEDTMDAIESYLVALSGNGQIMECKWPVAVVRGGYRATAMLLEADSLRPGLYNSNVRESVAKLHRCKLASPDVHVIGPEPDTAPVCTCRRRSSMIMETDFLEHESPLRCGECFGPIPLYRFPHTTRYGTYEDIICWAKDYHCLDELWTARGSGARLAYHELTDLDSELSKEGRDVCRRVEKLSKTPTYYYLFRYLGRGMGSERKRCCPCCNRQWLLAEQWHDRYDFRCDRCRLVSNIAYGVH